LTSKNSSLAQPWTPTELSVDRPVWERQPQERDPAWEAFTIYRDMDLPRRLIAVAEQLQKSEALIRRWAAHWQWRKRVDGYDGNKDEEARQQRIADAKDAITQQVTMGRNLSVRSYNALLQMFTVDEHGQVSTPLGPSDLVRLLTSMTDLWRRSAGVPDRVEGVFAHHVTQEAVDGSSVTGLLADPIFRTRLDALAERMEGIASSDSGSAVEGRLAETSAPYADFPESS